MTPAYDSEAVKRGLHPGLSELWTHVPLLALLVQVNLSARYRRSALGVWWSFLNPLALTAVLFLVFNGVFNFRAVQGVPFAPYLLSGVVLITTFSQSFNASVDSIASNAGLLGKIRIAPQVLAFATSIANGLHFTIALLPVVIVSLLSGLGISGLIVLGPVIIVCVTLLTCGLSLIAAGWYIRFEDFRSVGNLVLLLLGYMTPVFYPINMLHGVARYVVTINPLSIALECLRTALNSGGNANPAHWIYLMIVSVFVFLLGIQRIDKHWPHLIGRL